jgi:CubicO group peptidase (beta-lactamase class C family)
MTIRFAHRLLVPAAIALTLGLARPLPADVVHGDRGAAIDRYLTCLSEFGISGALYVAKDGEVLIEKGYGLADRTSGAKVSAASPFLLGSLSKQFTAAAILALETDGKLVIADSLGRFFPDAPPATRRLTLEQLLSHTSGLPYFPQRSFFETRPRDSVMREMLELPLEFSPGSKYSYSNCGYALLAGVIERASGQRFEEYVKGRIFERAGLARTRCLEPSLRDTADLGLVHSYSSDQDEGDVLQLRDMSKSVGVGSVVSTVADLGRWADALAGDRVLPAAERAKLFTPRVAMNARSSYGFGWMVAKTSRGTTIFFHAGDIGGWNAEMRIDRDAALVIVFLSNSRFDGKGSRDAVMTPVTLMATGASVAALPVVREAAPDQRRALEGRYRFPDGGALTARGVPARHRAGPATSLEVSADNAAGFARLAGDAARPADSLQYTERAVAIAEGLARRDYAALSAAIHPSLPGGVRPAELDTTLEDAERRWGSFVRVEVLGSADTGPGAGLSFVRIVRERGSSMLRLGWVNGKVLAFDLDAGDALATRFLPATDGSWVSVDPFTARVTRIDVARDAGGRVQSLGVGAGEPRGQRENSDSSASLRGR